MLVVLSCTLVVTHPFDNIYITDFFLGRLLFAVRYILYHIIVEVQTVVKLQCCAYKCNQKANKRRFCPFFKKKI